MMEIFFAIYSYILSAIYLLDFVGITFMIVCLALHIASNRKSNETTQETKAERTRGQRLVNRLLLIAGIFSLIFLLHSIILLIIALPVSAVIVFAILLTRYIRARKKQKNCPEEITVEELKYQKKLLLIFPAVLVVAMVALIGIIVLLLNAIPFM